MSGETSEAVFKQTGDDQWTMRTPPYYEITLSTTMYCPQNFEPEFLSHYRKSVALKSAASRESLYSIYIMAKQCRSVDGVYVECGTHRGGSAALLADVMDGSGKKLHLFDTFSGMPETDPDRDIVRPGTFDGTDVETVRANVGHQDFVELHPGRIPETFAGLDLKIAFAYVDLDIYHSTLDCLAFVYPRMTKGGVILLDDFARPTCPGATQAINEFFADKPEFPLPIESMQALVVKL